MVKKKNDSKTSKTKEKISISMTGEKIAEKYKDVEFPFAVMTEEESLIASLAALQSLSPDDELSEEEETLEDAEGGYFDDNDYYCDDEED